MFPALSRSLDDLGLPRLRQVLQISVLTSVGGYLVLAVVLWAVAANTQIFETGWLEWVADIFGGVLILIVAFILFPAVVGAISSMFLESVVNAVEQKHYPHLPPATTLSFLANLSVTMKFLVALVIINIVAIPFYFTIFAIFVIYGINGYLLGREYFELVAYRRLSAQDVKIMRTRYSMKLLLVGILIALGLTIPLVNFLVPIWASIYMTHVFHDLLKNE